MIIHYRPNLGVSVCRSKRQDVQQDNSSLPINPPGTGVSLSPLLRQRQSRELNQNSKKKKTQLSLKKSPQPPAILLPSWAMFLPQPGSRDDFRSCQFHWRSLGKQDPVQNEQCYKPSGTKVNPSYKQAERIFTAPRRSLASWRKVISARVTTK